MKNNNDEVQYECYSASCDGIELRPTVPPAIGILWQFEEFGKI